MFAQVYDAEHQQHLDAQAAAIDQATASLAAAQERDAATKEREAARADRGGGTREDDAEWKAGIRDGRIDGRSQNHYDLSGNLIKSKGKLAPGATEDGMGFVEGPSRLAPKDAPDAGGEAMQGAAASTQQAGAKTAEAAAAVKAGADVLNQGSAEMATAASALQSAASAWIKTARDLKARLDAMERGT